MTEWFGRIAALVGAAGVVVAASPLGSVIVVPEKVTPPSVSVVSAA